MTTDLQTRIAAIKAECEKMLKLSENATPGKWIAEGNTVWRVESDSESSSICDTVSHAHDSDARFIAHSRNVSPAMARVVIATIRNIKFAMQIDKLRERATEAAEELVKQWEGK